MALGDAGLPALPQGHVLRLVEHRMPALALGQPEDVAAQRHFLMREAVELAHHLSAGPQAQHAVHRRDLPLHVMHLAQQPLQHFPVHRHRTPRHRGIHEHAHELGALQRIQLLLAEAHRLAATQLAVVKIVQRLGNDCLIERMRCRHGSLLSAQDTWPGSPASRSNSRRARRSRRNSFTSPASLRRVARPP